MKIISTIIIRGWIGAERNLGIRFGEGLSINLLFINYYNYLLSSFTFILGIHCHLLSIIITNYF